MITGLSIAIEQNGDKRILRLEGRIDAQTLPTLGQQIDADFEKMHLRILLDFTGVERVTGDALELLFKETKKFKEVKGALGLSGISDPVMQTIKNAGFDQLLLIYCDEREALIAMV
jgi:anti-anti-sigma factor